MALGLSIPEVAGRARSGVDPATAALVARMSSTPGVARVGAIDALVRGTASSPWAIK